MRIFCIHSLDLFQVPKPRSGVAMSLHASDDSIYVYGGYSKEKVTGSFKEGNFWMNCIYLQCSAAQSNG